MTPKEKTTKKEGIFFSKVEKASEQFDTFRKFLMNVLIVFFTLFIGFLLIRTSTKNRMKIMPVATPENLQKMGFTPEVFTGKVLDRISFIKVYGSDYYRQNDIPLVVQDEDIELVSSLIAQTPLSEFRETIISLVNRDQQKAIGEVVEWDKGYEITFRIDNKEPIRVRSSQMDSLVHAAAVYIMETTDPYNLGAYLFVTEQYSDCLKLMQKLINNKEGRNKYLAMHIRGNVYIKQKDYDYARSILDSSLKMRNEGAPWLTYNSIGAIYQNTKNYAMAKQWYQTSMKSNPTGFNALYNYGQVLLDEYDYDSTGNINNKNADSAIYYFQKAAFNNPSNVKTYRGMLRAYSTLFNLQAGKEMFYKCIEMDPENLEPYLYMKSFAAIAGDTTLKKFCEEVINAKKKQ